MVLCWTISNTPTHAKTAPHRIHYTSNNVRFVEFSVPPQRAMDPDVTIPKVREFSEALRRNLYSGRQTKLDQPTHQAKGRGEDREANEAVITTPGVMT